MRVFFFICFFFLVSVIGFTQSIPLASPVFDDLIRIGQLTDSVNGQVSLMVRPVYPRKIFNRPNSFRFSSGSIDLSGIPSAASFQFWKKYGRIELLPVSFQSRFNSRYPYGRLDGAMMPARGYQNNFNAGIYGELGPLSIQYQPQVIWAQNKKFERFGYDNELFWYRYRFWYISEDPEEVQAGNSTSRFSSGQSSIRLNYRGHSVGYSTENISWGPGNFNNLIFSNNAEGFKHFTINTTRPIKTPIGNIEYQLLSGRLEGLNLSYWPNISRRKDWRYLSAMNFVYSPKFLPGLHLGFERTFQLYNTDLGKGLGSYFPLFEGFQKKNLFENDDGQNYDNKNTSQQIALSLRWVWQESNAEFYLQYGRRDHAYNLRDLMMSPEHARAYIIGFNKLFATTYPGRFIQLRSEVTHTQESINILARYGPGGGNSWGTHGPVIHGFTNRGQQMGNGVGPGNNLQVFEISYLHGIRKVGFILERLEHQMDFYTNVRLSRPNFRPWVDISPGFVGRWNVGKLFLNGQVQYVRSLNYQWLQKEVEPGSSLYKGIDRNNLFVSLDLVYSY